MFQLEIEGFSGPLDLLCHMIDQGQIEAARISVAEVISIYGAYLAQNGGLPIASVAEFIAQAAHLVRQKASSLLPRYEVHKEDGEVTVLDDTENVESLLERYRPYREAVLRLIELKEKADRRRFRKGEALDPFFDLGDLYSLSLQWLELLDRRRSLSLELLGEDDWVDDGVPAQIPDEVQVEKRMERVLERLTAFSEGLSLRSLMKEEPGRGALVVTLLALLELSRRNFVTLVQKELFGDVFITARRA